MLVALRPPVRFQEPRRDSHSDFAFLDARFTPDSVFMEIGAASCKLALRAAGYVERVYAIDVSGHFVQNVLVPVNLRLVLCDGVRIPVPEGTVDLAWSGAFMDQLHPDDAGQHLASVHRALAPSGEYVIRTSQSIDETRKRLLVAGFAEVRYYAGGTRIPAAFSPLIPQNLLRIGAIK
jgi:SAM-dependent methyltransferase